MILQFVQQNVVIAIMELNFNQLFSWCRIYSSFVIIIVVCYFFRQKLNKNSFKFPKH